VIKGGDLKTAIKTYEDVYEETKAILSKFKEQYNPIADQVIQTTFSTMSDLHQFLDSIKVNGLDSQLELSKFIAALKEELSNIDGDSAYSDFQQSFLMMSNPASQPLKRKVFKLENDNKTREAYLKKIGPSVVKLLQ
jgi:hypothetical protein